MMETGRDLFLFPRFIEEDVLHFVVSDELPVVHGIHFLAKKVKFIEMDIVDATFVSEAVKDDRVRLAAEVSDIFETHVFDFSEVGVDRPGGDLLIEFDQRLE